MLIAPLSELYGKLAIYHVANIVFILFSVAAALSSNLKSLIAFRFLSGFAVASGVLNSAIVGDLFIQEQRGRAMAAMGVTVFLGPILGPVIGGYLSQAAGWRWDFWFVAIVTGFLELGFALILREFYKVTILQRKVECLVKETGNASNDKANAGFIHLPRSIRPCLPLHYCLRLHLCYGNYYHKHI